MAQSPNAVFLSYASQDAPSAQRICQALRAAGIEVWFDQSELRGGDLWDQSIRKQIKTCALFVPIISRNTHARPEGYFRLEWKLAVDRSHLIMSNKAFLVPVVIDATPDDEENVPDGFRDVQWTRLPEGETPPAFVKLIQQLLSQDLPLSADFVRRPTQAPAKKMARYAMWLVACIIVAAIGVTIGLQRRAVAPQSSTVTFTPPPHSIAVLPFVNMSGEPAQETFSDGLTEELLNSLSDINELRVAARTSAFSFKGTNTDIGTIARKLNVGTVLEGSIRRSGNTVRITVQLVNALTGFHLWSHTYDRDFADVLTLETEIAGAVASALKVSLLGEVATKIESGGTRNASAFDAFLRGGKAQSEAYDPKGFQIAIDAYTEAIRLDPNYATAFANRSIALNDYAGNASGSEAVRKSFELSKADALRAIELAPHLAEGHLALSFYFEQAVQDFSRASEEYERAVELAPGDARVLRDYGLFAVYMGRADPGIAALRHATVLDPLNRLTHLNLGQALYYSRRHQEALAAFQNVLALNSGEPIAYAYVGLTYYAMNEFEQARISCETKPDYRENQRCLAVTYDKLHRLKDAQSMFDKQKTAMGDAGAYQYAEMYAQWGKTSSALDWLETASRLSDPGLELLRTDPLLDPLRVESRFKAIEQSLKFAD